MQGRSKMKRNIDSLLFRPASSAVIFLKTNPESPRS